MGWTEIHDATQKAVVLASGFIRDRVIWKYQNADAPLLSYIALAFATGKTIGQDGIRADYDSTRPANRQIRLTTRGVREYALEIEVFTDSTADSCDAQAVCEAIKSSLLHPEVVDMLDSVELSIFDPGAVQYIPDVPNVKFRGRATCTLRCYVPALLAATFTTFIESFSGTIHVTGENKGPVDIPYEVPEDS